MKAWHFLVALLVFSGASVATYYSVQSLAYHGPSIEEAERAVWRSYEEDFLASLAITLHDVSVVDCETTDRDTIFQCHVIVDGELGFMGLSQRSSRALDMKFMQRDGVWSVLE